MEELKGKWDRKRKGRGEGKGREGKRKKEEKGKEMDGSGPLHLSQRGCVPAFFRLMLMLKFVEPISPFHMLNVSQSQ